MQVTRPLLAQGSGETGGNARRLGSLLEFFAGLYGLLASGIVNGVILVGSFRALLTTSYGELLLLKVALFAVMLGFAAVTISGD